jgi:hypothetical protein
MLKRINKSMLENYKIQRIKNSFNYNWSKIFKDILWFILVAFCSAVTYLIFNESFDEYIVENLLFPEGFNLPKNLSILFNIAFFLCLIYCLSLSVKYKYSFKQTSIAFFSLYLIIYHSRNYVLVKDEITGLPYLYYLVFFLIILLLFFFYHKVKQHLYNPIKAKKTEGNLLLDLEVIDPKDDKLKYDLIVDKIYKQVSENDFSSSSFTIGLIGPWGNGKSSLLNLLSKKIKSEKNNSNLIIKYKPSISHSENEIISEFISVLNENLGPLSAKLSPKLLQYAQHLTNAYNSKNILGLINIKQKVNVSKSSSVLFNEINKAIQDIGKKIIIFIDDLDRLDAKEILQIFKIIRNTASFRNTVFIVGLDKAYTIKRLIESAEVHDSSYLDKFFQLEVHLPEIDKDILKKYFVQQLLSLDKNYNEVDFKEFVEKSSFAEFTSNIRGVKRLINQIRFDYNPNTEILFNEWIELSIFKLNFPGGFRWVLKNLKDKRIFEKKNNLYNLKITTEETKFAKKDNDYLSKNFLDLTKKEQKNILEYNIAQLLYNKESMVIAPPSVLNSTDKYKFISLLIGIFANKTIGDENVTCQNELNLIEILELKEYKLKLTNKSFLDFIISTAGKNKLRNKPDFLSDDAKTAQYFEKIIIHANQGDDELKNSVRSLLLISEYTEHLIQDDVLDVLKIKISNLSKENDFSWFPILLDEVDISDFDKLNLIRHLHASEGVDGFKFEYLGEKNTISKLIEKWLNNYHADFFNYKKEEQFVFYVHYFVEKGLVDKSKCIEAYKAMIKSSPIEFANKLVINITSDSNLNTIHKDVIDTVGFEWLKGVYETANATESNDKLEDVINLLKLVTLSDKCGLTDIHYSPKSKELRDLLYDSHKIDANSDKDNIIFSMSEEDYNEAVANPKSILKYNIFMEGKGKFSIGLQGKLNKVGTQFKVNETIFNIKNHFIEIDGKNQLIQYSSKERYINLGK